MAKITQKQLIESLKQLKEIKPRAEWAVLLRSQVLAEKKLIPVPARHKEHSAEKSVGIMDIFSSLFLQRKLAYSFAVILFFIVVAFGFSVYTVPGDMLFPAKKIAEQSTAALTGQTGIKQDIATLNSRINDLDQVAKAGKTDNIPSAISEVNANVSELVKSLKNNPAQDSQTLKEITSSFKTLADVPGTDLTSNPDVNYVYQTLAQNQIADLQKTTLTDDQKNTLAQAQDLYNQGNYEKAFELLLENK